MSDHIKLLIADDNSLTRDGIKRLLQSEPTIQVVGEVVSITDLADSIIRLGPDVVLLDIKWGRSEFAGFKALERIKNARHSVKIVLHTAHPKLLDGDMRVNLADGLILNSMSGQVLLSEIQRVAGTGKKEVSKEQKPLLKLAFFSIFLLLFLSFLAFLVIQIGTEPLQVVVYTSILLFIVVVVVFFAYIGKVKTDDFITFVNKVITRIMQIK